MNFPSLSARDPKERGRVASSLELFFDLVFVVAVSITSAQLHGALAAGDVVHGIAMYFFVFFSIWWAWMNFTWFGTSFGSDDWLYRVLTLLQMGGALVFAAGIPFSFEHGDMRGVLVGYVIMRIAQVIQWLRASKVGGEAGRAARWYAGGIALAQFYWVAIQLIPDGPLKIAAFALGMVIELSVPVIAERQGRTTWHAHHITERYGAFTLIVLGESLLASVNAVIEALEEGDAAGRLIFLATLSFIATACLWWIYFWVPHHHAIRDLSNSLRYGYGHIFIFASAAVLSTGTELAVEQTLGHSELSTFATNLAFCLPVAIFLAALTAFALWQVADKYVRTAMIVGVVAIVVDAFLPASISLTAVALIALVVVVANRAPIKPRATTHNGDNTGLLPPKRKN